MTVLSSTSAPDAGHKVKLLGVMVVEGGSNLDGAGLQVDLFANRGSTEMAMPP